MHVQFNVDSLEELIWSDQFEELEVALREHVDSTRWTEVYRLVFATDGRWFETFYESPSTECQEGIEPFEREAIDGYVECLLVEPFEKKVIDYRKVDI